MIKFAELKKFFIWSFIGSLIVAALVAVITVLVGKYTEVTERVFATLFMVVAHSLVSLTFIWSDNKRNTFEKLTFFINTLFLLIVASFITSLFGIWKLISGETMWHLYTTFFLIGFAVLHIDILSKARGKEKYMDIIIEVNYLFIAMVALLLQPLIYLKNPMLTLGEVYYRGVAAAAIIDGTLSILTIIFYRLYLHKHPEAAPIFQENVPGISGQTSRRKMSIWVWIFIIFLLLQFFGILSSLLF